jgi:hypothetical protein
MRIKILLAPLSIWIAKNEIPDWFDNIITYILENNDTFPLYKSESTKEKRICINSNLWARVQDFNNIDLSLREFCTLLKSEGFNQIEYHEGKDCYTRNY